ncbi:MAG: hypothetical protein AB7D36_09445 [Oscillospiraceae bacterium]
MVIFNTSAQLRRVLAECHGNRNAARRRSARHQPSNALEVPENAWNINFEKPGMPADQTVLIRSL